MLNLCMIILLGGALIWGGAIGLGEHWVGRHLKKHYPNHWRDLGSPDLWTAQGPRSSRVGEWIRSDRYKRLHDEKLDRWIPILQQLPRRLGAVMAMLALVAIAAVVLMN